jgi:NAD(P)H-flavin reductase
MKKESDAILISPRKEDAADPMLPEPYRVRRTKRDTHDTFTLELEAGNSHPRPFFLPGQFNMLYAFGVGEVPISISGSPLDERGFMHTTRVVGVVTTALRKLKRGDAVGIRGPFGSHWPIEESEGRDIVIVAGGIGLAPLRPVLPKLLTDRAKYKKIIVLYGARTPEDLLYLTDLEKWQKENDLEIHRTVDRVVGTWRGSVGVVPSLVPKAPFDPANAIAMVCGPEIMMRFTILALLKRGMKAENIYLSMERNMKCAIGFCGHCQYGPTFICKDGPVFRYDRISWIFSKREI